MTDPIAALLRAADVAAHEAGLTPDPVAAVRARVAHRRRRRRLTVGTAAAVVVLLAGTAVLVAGRADDEPEGVVLAPSTTTPAEEGAYGDVPPSPLDPRRQVALAPVGDDAVVVWGGFRSGAEEMTDGAVYDRSTGEWRTMAPSPLADLPPSGVAPVAAPVEGGAVIARDDATARWDRATDTWTELDDAPGTVTDLVPVGDGRLVSVGARAVLDVATGVWTEVPPPPVALVATTAVAWTGEELVVVAGPAATGPGLALALDPVTLAWRALAPPPASMAATGLAASWDGERVVVTDHEMTAVAYDPATDAWEELQEVPARFAEHHPSSASVGGTTVVSTARTLAVLDARREIWTPFPSPDPSDGGGPPGRWLVAVDDSTLALWVDDAATAEADLVLFDPTTLAGRDRRRQVGVASVVTAGDEYVLGSFATGQGALVVDLMTAAGEHCRVTSGYGLPLGSAEQRAVREEVPVEDPAGRRPDLVWFHDEVGTRWEAEVEDGDLLVVDCDDAGAARRVVGSVALT